MTEPSKGAYGLRVGLPIAEDDLVDAPAGWPRWHLCWRETPRDRRRPQQLGPDEALFDLQPVGQMLVNRRTSTSTLLLPGAPPAEAWSHPYLSATAIHAAWWSGHRSFHAGAFLAGGGAWGILGDKEQGKSSAVAWLAAREYPVLCDDLLVIAGGRALAGPRCLDLRQSASAHYGLGTYIGQVGARERWRVRLPPVPAEVPFRGWVALSWADDVSVASVRLEDRLGRMLAHRGLRIPETEDRGLLDLITRPMVELRRPKSWSALDRAMTHLLDALSSV